MTQTLPSIGKPLIPHSQKSDLPEEFTVETDVIAELDSEEVF